ncbi:hypothetical protein L8R46_24305, partial [Enterobacter roggenkampii]|nr:hypothetical protein [Enterobacter roggenkampii]
CGKKIGPDPRNFNQRVSLGRNDLLIRTFPKETYCREWGFDEHKKTIIDAIDFHQVEFTKPHFSSVEIGWER